MSLEETCKNLSLLLEKNLKSLDDYFNAAVLIPLCWDGRQLSVLFEVRSSHLSWQPNEICFPGGRIETFDVNPLAAAVRETTEELGIVMDDIDILGSIPEFISPIGVRVYPYVAYLKNLEVASFNQNEVAEIFVVPLDFLLNNDPIIAHMQRGTRPLEDFPFDLLPNYSKEWQIRKKYTVLFYKYEKHVIWGLTAQILYNFLQVYKEIDDEK